MGGGGPVDDFVEQPCCTKKRQYTQPPAERAVVSPAHSSARMVPSHCTGSTSWRGNRAAISAASLKGWAVTLE